MQSKPKRQFEFGRWYPIETAPKRGECLVWWPTFRLDDDGKLTDEQLGGERLVSCRAPGIHPSGWREPDHFEANGAYFGDDWEHGAGPTMWSPIPKEPQ